MIDSHPKIRLFVDQPLQAGINLALPPEQAHYLLNVMRAADGTPLALFNGQDGEWLGELAPISKKKAEVRLVTQRKPQKSSPNIWLVFAPIKHGRIDFLAEKATELGASKLQPVMTARTNAARVKTERLRSNAIEAAEQSERLDVPEVAEPLGFAQLLAQWSVDRLLIYGDESGQGEAPDCLFAKLPKTEKYAVLVGPEGGFTPEEFTALRAHKHAHAISLGPRILRADTAGLAALTCLQAWRGDWQEKPRFEG